MNKKEPQMYLVSESGSSRSRCVVPPFKNSCCAAMQSCCPKSRGCRCYTGIYSS